MLSEDQQRIKHNYFVFTVLNVW